MLLLRDVSARRHRQARSPQRLQPPRLTRCKCDTSSPPVKAFSSRGGTGFFQRRSRGRSAVAPKQSGMDGMDNEDDAARAAMIEMVVETMRSTVAVARALVDAGVAIDLDGLDREVSDLCADAISLPRTLGRDLASPLGRLLDEVAALESALADRSPL
ncbi:MAG: hypothetical protein RML45_06210 [Acetobacteraceae bacterium]|nr:hypothetical protein [Acetobacteraceae bacterium]